MKILSSSFLALLATAGMASAQAYSTNFNSYPNPSEIAGQDGWVSSEPGTTYLSWTQPSNVSGPVSTGAAVGGQYDDPTASSISLSHGVNVPVLNAFLDVDFAIIPSTVADPGQDSFGWELYGAGGSEVLTIDFVPDTVDPTRILVNWSSNGGASVFSGTAISYDAPYNLYVTLTETDFNITISGIGTSSFSGSLAGVTAGDSLTGFAATFTEAAAVAGTNYMVFDDLAVGTVPEPSVGLLALGALLPVLSRRRKVA